MSDGKGVQGRGRLTKERIDSFQVFYGKAIRDNKGNPEAMSQATKAILHHYADLPPAQQHQYCPEGADSWCKYQLDASRCDGVTTYSNVKNPLSKALYDLLLPTFDSLSDIHLLAACAECKDQNANESLHSVIWGKVSKDKHHSPVEVGLGINMGVMHFNDGCVSTMSALVESAGLLVAESSMHTWCKIDNTRVKDSERHNKDKFIDRRRKRRQSKLKQLDAFKRVEGSTYQSGAFHVSTPVSTSKKQARKPPHCSKCGRRKLGHPKGTCSTDN